MSKVRSRNCSFCGEPPPNGQSFGWCNKHDPPRTLCRACLEMGWCGCGPGKAVDGSETPTVMTLPTKLTKALTDAGVSDPVPAVLLSVLLGRRKDDGRRQWGLQIQTAAGPQIIELPFDQGIEMARRVLQISQQAAARDRVN